VDKTLLKRIKQGDKSAFSLVVERFQQPMFSYLGKMGLSQALAEEVAQETFIRAWQAREQYDSAKSSIVTWLFTIARRLAINELQRAMHRYEQSNTDQSSDSYLFDDGLHKESLHDADQHETSDKTRHTLLSEALDSLSVDDRSLLAFAYVKEFEFSVIAEIEGIPIGTVKSRLYRIRQALKKTLNEGK
jgi:RNA polymerase sigma-70 factor (ECF subfamily)